MSKKYRQLSIEEREIIQTGLWEGQSVRSIACTLNRSPSSISREIRRNCPPEKRRYTPRVAQEKARDRIQRRGQRPRLKNEFIEKYVIQKLKSDFSPEQIAGRLRIEYPECQISHEAIYQFIYAQYQRSGWGKCIGEDLRILLKRGHKVRKPKHVPFASEKGPIANRISIDERPRHVNDRALLGHWEGDSMVSRKSHFGLNTLVERKSGLLLVSRIKDSTKNETTKAVIRRLKKIPLKFRQTLTLDNGHENAGHLEVTKALKINIYFAHPYCSCERGTNENTNGLIRYYLPKGTDFAKVTKARIKAIEDRLNNRPRKRLGYKTPLEVLNEVLH